MRAKLLFLLICLLLAVPASAQDSNWQTWLYDANAHRAIQINQNGSVLRDTVLPTLQNHDIYSPTVTVDNTGRYIAYSVRSSNMNTMQFLVYDSLTSNWAATYSPQPPPSADSFDINARRRMFNAVDNTVAYGYLWPDFQNWSVVILNIDSNQEIARIDSTSVTVQQAVQALNATFTPLPVVMNHSAGVVDFILLPYGTEAFAPFPSLRWELSTGNVALSNRYPTMQADYLPTTGEIISPNQDEDWANSLQNLMFPVQNNIVQVLQPMINQPQVFLNRADLSYNTAIFIDAGRLILTQAYNVLTEGFEWAVVTRGGINVAAPPIQSTSPFSIGAAGTGFIYTLPNMDNGAGATITVMQVDGAALNQPGNPVWVSPAGLDALQIVWVSPPVLPGQVQYQPWEFLSGPITAQPVPLPTATTPVISGVLTVGGVAIVQTTEGDMLNIRSGPGTSFSRIAQVAPGARVTLLEGPRSGDGFVWWRIRLPEGLEGWVVERADNVQTLLPTSR